MDSTSVSGMVFMALEIQISVLKISDRRSVLKCPSVFPRRGLLDTGGHIPNVIELSYVAVSGSWLNL